MNEDVLTLVERLRIPLSRLVVGILLVLALISAHSGAERIEGALMEQGGFALLIIAALGRIWSTLYIGGRKDSILCCEGPYSLTRNPLYFFSFLGVIGFAMALQSWLMVLLYGGVFLFAYRGVIRGEEKRLLELFGEDYADYLRRTPRFFPALRRPAPMRGDFYIKPRQVERALKDVAWFLMMILFLELLEMLHDRGICVFFHLPF